MDKIKLLVFDIDGTLIDRSKQTVEASAKAAINQAKEKGYEILIATGRSFFFIHEDVKKSIDTDFFVTVNGACLNDPSGEIIQSYAFDNESLKTLIDYCQKNNYDLGIKYNKFIGVYGDYNNFVKNYVGHDHPGVKYLKFDEHNDFYKTNDALGVYYFAPTETLAEVAALIPNLSFVPSDQSAIEAMRCDVDKTKNIEDVLKRLDLTWDNVATFGDAHNDIEMLQKARFGVAMGNAHDEVKEHADYVTSHILDDGIEKALKHLNII
ncbi:MAG: HAD family hydrolase [Erysipelothrix sp.]|nr:HAD family hydrolase [Erysipelothrix sp.]